MNGVIGMLQVFAPKLLHVAWLPAPDQWGGRATGNLRQPNSLAGLLLWSMAAAVWLGESRVLRRPITSSLVFFFLLVTVLTASRMGALSTLVLFAWGAFDRRLHPRTRLLLVGVPLVYACFWALLAVGTQENYMAFGGAPRFTGTGVVATNRYGLWMDSMGLIRDHPWLGVGFGNFNFAWTLTPVRQRPESFDHAHNLIVHLAAEVGLPCTALILGSVAYAAWRAFRLDRNSNSGDSAVSRASLVMIALIGVHSMLEYPLWYSFGLLPSAFLAGLCLECTGTSNRSAVDTSDETASTRPLVLACVGMIFCAVFAYVDYQRVAAIYRHPVDDALLRQRVDAGRRSILFGNYADYAAAMLSREPDGNMSVFPRSTHHVLDARLMMVWSLALDARGDSDKARYLAQRLREFHFDETKSYFAPCDTGENTASPNMPSMTHAQLPFQCLAPVHAWTYEDFQ